MKQGRSIVELATEIQRRAGAKVDFVADTRSLYVEPDSLNLTVRPDTGEPVSYPMTQHTIKQIATWEGIPAKYVDRMQSLAPDLLAVNFNHWMRVNHNRRMIRTLDGEARAFLSDRYRRLDNEEILEHILPILIEAQEEIRIESCQVTDTRMFVKAVFPKVEGEVKVGDTVQAGVQISNSEIGSGSLQVMPLVFRLVCSNGMVANDSGLSRYHVGRRVGHGSDVEALFQDDTKAADDRALMLQLRDVVKASMNEAVFQGHIEKLREASEGPKIEKPIPAVEILAKSFGLREGEKESAIENLIRDKDYSRWGALNAITRIANDTESYDRASELEQVGGRILDLNPTQWKQIAEAA